MDRSVSVEARRLTEVLFGDYMATNLFTLGVAYQVGLLPLSAASLEAAIRLNGVQEEQNLQAFRYGRLYVADPARVADITEAPQRGFDDERTDVLAHLSDQDAQAYVSLLDRCAHLDDESQRMLAIRIGELIDYQDAQYPESYVDFVLRTAAREQEAAAGQHDITQAVICHLYKLMAYKDEYEVARLHLKPRFQTEARGLFLDPQRLVYQFHPPLLRALGFKRKLQFGPWFTPVLRLLHRLRKVRGTRWDIFGYSETRQEERRLIGWYTVLIETALWHLDQATYTAVADIARLPDGIRGYEEIRLQNFRVVQEQAEKLTTRLKESRVTPPEGL
jgi:indolepyruvate ferredoxin oxidoreductase